MPQPTYLTREGLKKLQDELTQLSTVRRREIAERFQQSRERGGTVSNAEYEEAQNERSFNEGRIQALENMINNAVIIDEGQEQRDAVDVGATVTVRNPQGRPLTYTITGSAEADPAQAGSPTSPPSARACWARRSVKSPKSARRPAR